MVTTDFGIGNGQRPCWTMRDCVDLKLDSAEFNRRPGLKYD